MRSIAVLAALACAAALAACGGGSSDAGSVRTAPRPRSPLDLPAGVPLTGSGAAEPQQAKVIRAWAAALRGGDVRGASDQWSVPSAVQNGSPVVELHSAGDVRRFNVSLPCGAVVTKTAKAPHGFTIVSFRLVKRKGASCGSGVGGSARTAIRVVGGKIAEWYRLPGPGETAPPPDLAPGSQGPTV